MLISSLPVAVGLAYAFIFVFWRKLTIGGYEGRHRPETVERVSVTYHPSESALVPEPGPRYPNMWMARMERASFILRVPVAMLPRTIEWYRYRALKNWNWAKVPVDELPRLWWQLNGANRDMVAGNMARFTSLSIGA